MLSIHLLPQKMMLEATYGLAIVAGMAVISLLLYKMSVRNVQKGFQLYNAPHRNKDYLADATPEEVKWLERLKTLLGDKTRRIRGQTLAPAQFERITYLLLSGYEGEWQSMVSVLLNSSHQVPKKVDKRAANLMTFR